MSEWKTSEEGSVMTYESVKEGFEALKEGIGKIRPDYIPFRGIIFEAGDPRLSFMIRNNIKTYKELMERYPNE